MGIAPLIAQPQSTADSLEDDLIRSGTGRRKTKERPSLEDTIANLVSFEFEDVTVYYIKYLIHVALHYHYPL